MFGLMMGTIVTNKTQNINANLNISGAHKLIGDSFTATTSFGLRQERRQSDGVFNQGRNIPAGVTDVNYGVVQAVAETQFLVKDLAWAGADTGPAMMNLSDNRHASASKISPASPTHTFRTLPGLRMLAGSNRRFKPRIMSISIALL